MSASWTPDAARLRWPTARVKRPIIIIRAVPPMAKMTKAKKMMYGDELSLKGRVDKAHDEENR